MSQHDWLEKDFYKTLGVSESVTEKDLTKAYRKLARKYHPDANPNDSSAEDKFKEVSEAYDVLGDAERRKEYDELRKYGARGGLGGSPFGGGQGGSPGGGFGFENIEASGGITEANIEAYAKTGIDYVSTAEASRARNIDLSMLIENS